jgi:hypothetical protein
VCPLRSCSVNESPVVCHRGQRDDEGTSCDKRERGLTGKWEGWSYPGQHGQKANWRRASPARTPHLVIVDLGRTNKVQRTRNLQILVYLCSVKHLQFRDKALCNAAQRQQVAQSPPIFGISIQIRTRPTHGLAGQSPTRDPCPCSSVDTRCVPHVDTSQPTSATKLSTELSSSSLADDS